MAKKKSKLAKRAAELEAAVAGLFTRYPAAPAKKKKRKKSKKAKVVKAAKKTVKKAKKAPKRRSRRPRRRPKRSSFSLWIRTRGAAPGRRLFLLGPSFYAGPALEFPKQQGERP